MKLFALVLIALASLTTTADDSLIGGTPGAKGQYPEIVYIRGSDGAKSWRCSATIVGPQVILTAGHCVVDQGTIGPASHVVEVGEGLEYTARCLQAPLYRSQEEDHDMALCKVENALELKPASIAKAGPAVGDKVTLTGYGCIKAGGGGGNDGILRTGIAPVTKLPSGPDHWFYTLGSVALCFGDSGGPSMLAGTDKHLVIGVNSRGDIKELSLLTALWTAESQSFLQDFAKDQKVDICGITEDCT